MRLQLLTMCSIVSADREADILLFFIFSIEVCSNPLSEKVYGFPIELLWIQATYVISSEDVCWNNHVIFLSGIGDYKSFVSYYPYLTSSISRITIFFCYFHIFTRKTLIV